MSLSSLRTRRDLEQTGSLKETEPLNCRCMISTWYQAVNRTSLITVLEGSDKIKWSSASHLTRLWKNRGLGVTHCMSQRLPKLVLCRILVIYNHTRPVDWPDYTAKSRFGPDYLDLEWKDMVLLATRSMARHISHRANSRSVDSWSC